MSNIWPADAAKENFNDLLETALTQGPQIVTQHGVAAAVLVPIDQWPTLKDLLLAPEARTEQLAPPRPALRNRIIPTFD